MTKKMSPAKFCTVPAASIAVLSDVFLFFGTFDAILSH